MNRKALDRARALVTRLEVITGQIERAVDDLCRERVNDVAHRVEMIEHRLGTLAKDVQTEVVRCYESQNGARPRRSLRLVS
jgi:hypothetical protein